MNDIWTSVDGKVWKQHKPPKLLGSKTPMWRGRGEHAVVTMSLKGVERLYLFGGRTGLVKDGHDNPYLNDFWSSDDGITWRLQKKHCEWSPRGSFIGKNHLKLLFVCSMCVSLLLISFNHLKRKILLFNHLKLLPFDHLKLLLLLLFNHLKLLLFLSFNRLKLLLLSLNHLKLLLFNHQNCYSFNTENNYYIYSLATT